MICFFVFVAFALISGVIFFASSLAKDPTDKRDGRLVGLGVFVFSLIFLAVASFASVGTKNVGILTTFGHPGKPLSNGLHLKAPWQVKHELPDAIQTDTYASDRQADGSLAQQNNADGSCINVRIARQATACVNVSVRWQIKEDGVRYLFRNYKDNASITKNLLLRDLQTTVNETFSSYDPLGLDKNGNTTQPSAPTLAAKVQAAMREDLSEYIDVNSLLIPIFNFDQGTQDKLNQLQQQYAATRVAQQQLLTNTAQAAANRALAASVSNNPGVLQSKCLDIVKQAIDAGKSDALPAGFTCFGGGVGLSVGTK